MSVSKILFCICAVLSPSVEKSVDNEQVRKPAICDMFVLEIPGFPLGELEGNRENLPSFFVKSCFFKIR